MRPFHPAETLDQARQLRRHRQALRLAEHTVNNWLRDRKGRSPLFIKAAMTVIGDHYVQAFSPGSY